MTLIGHDVKALDAANEAFDRDDSTRALAYLIVAALCLTCFCVGVHVGATSLASQTTHGGVERQVTGEVPPNPWTPAELEGQTAEIHR